MPDPQPIPYATPPSRRVASAGRMSTGATVGWQTVAGAAWLAGALGAAGVAITTLSDQQRALSPTLFYTLLTVASAGLGVTLANGIYLAAAPAGFALAVGAVAAAALYDWPRGRLAWIAVLPGVAGCWSGVLIVATSSGPGVGSLPGLCVAVAVQASLVYAGTHLGRPVVRWLTRQLVPPPLRASLLTLWG